MDTPFLEAMARELAARGHRVVRFEFPYMARRRETGQKSAPDRPAVLEETWRAVIEHLGADNLVIGGKSMGGRIASMVADASEVAALVCLGYPFHPVGKPDQLRVDHLRALRTAALFCQGTRDPFGTQAEVSQYELSPSIEFCWLDDGDHSFKPRKKSGRSAEQNLQQAVAAISDFLARQE
jgi:predicted alpha/beta-hydrolase family hydrolase